MASFAKWNAEFRHILSSTMEVRVSLSFIPSHLFWHPSYFFYVCVFTRFPWRWQSTVASLGDPCWSLTSLQHLPLHVFEFSSHGPTCQFFHLWIKSTFLSLLYISPSPPWCVLIFLPSSQFLSLSLHLSCIHITMETRQLQLLPAPRSRFHSIRIRGQRLEPQTGLHQFLFFSPS